MGKRKEKRKRRRKGIPVDENLIIDEKPAEPPPVPHEPEPGEEFAINNFFESGEGEPVDN